MEDTATFALSSLCPQPLSRTPEGPKSNLPLTQATQHFPERVFQNQIPREHPACPAFLSQSARASLGRQVGVVTVAEGVARDQVGIFWRQSLQPALLTASNKSCTQRCFVVPAKRCDYTCQTPQSKAESLPAPPGACTMEKEKQLSAQAPFSLSGPDTYAYNPMALAAG
jgi:hypothetical protein